MACKSLEREIMENLVCIHLVGSSMKNEEVGADNPASNDVKVFRKVKWGKVCRRAWINLISILVTIGTLGIATRVMAQISQGSKGPEVADVQAKLQKLGYFDRRPTGHFGLLTKQAVIRFQEDEGITANGIVEKETQTALSRRVDSNSTETKVDSNSTETKVDSNSTETKVDSNSTETKVDSNSTETKIDSNSTETQTASKPSTESKQEKAIVPGNKITLRRGDKGAEVKSLQQLLTDAGVYSGKITGTMDLQTSLAVRQFQRSHRIGVDGVVGLRTWTALAKGDNPTPDPTFNNSPFTSESLTDSSKDQSIASKPVTQAGLKQGDQGQDVKAVQQRLFTLGYYQGNQTGNFGPLTKEAVIKFQKDAGITPNGIVDSGTKAALITPRLASNSPALMEIQKKLQERGLYNGPIDGNYNDETKAALKEAQKASGVTDKDLITQP